MLSITKKQQLYGGLLIVAAVLIHMIIFWSFWFQDPAVDESSEKPTQKTESVTLTPISMSF